MERSNRKRSKPKVSHLKIQVCTTPLCIPLDWQTPSCCFSQAVVSGLVSTYHPHHHVRKSCNPQGRRSKGDHEPFLQVRLVTVGHCEVQDKTQGPCQDPLQHFHLASCQTTKERETITGHVCCISECSYFVSTCKQEASNTSACYAKMPFLAQKMMMWGQTQEAQEYEGPRVSNGSDYTCSSFPPVKFLQEPHKIQVQKRDLIHLQSPNGRVQKRWRQALHKAITKANGLNCSNGSSE